MKIIVGVDDSGYSIAALRSVLDREWGPDTEVRLVHAIEPFNFVYGSPYDAPGENPSELCRQVLEESQEKADALMQKWSKYLERKFGEKNVSHKIQHGDVVTSINEEAAAWEADLIVIGSHGKSAIDRLMIGGVSRKVSVTAPCSVQIVKLPPYSLAPLDEDSAPPENILVPLDDSGCSKAVVEQIIEHNWVKGSNLLLLAVVKSWADSIPFVSAIKHSDLTSADEKSKDSARRLLETYQNDLKECEPANIKTRVATGDPRDKILNSSTNWPADLIIMGSHGRGAVMSTLLGSVSDYVSINCHCPVQIIRPRKKQSD